MERFTIVLIAVLVLVLGIIGCAPQSDISTDEVIYIVKQSVWDDGMYVPLPSHWTAIYQGKGVWMIAWFVHPDDENYPDVLTENPEIGAKYCYPLYNYIYVSCYYEKSEAIENALEVFIPAKCWTAPDMPQAIYNFGRTVRPLNPTWWR